MSSPQNQAVSEQGVALERIVFFSDAIFAIAITLLAIELKVPELKVNSTDALLGALWTEWSRFLSFIFSFWIIAVFWLAHHRYFRYIKRYDERLIVLNMLMLFFVVLIPFTESLLGEYTHLAGGIWIYAANMFFLGISGGWLWHHASSQHRLTDKDLDPRFIRYIQVRALGAPIAAVIVVALSFFIGSLANLGWLFILAWHKLVSWRFQPPA